MAQGAPGLFWVAVLFCTVLAVQRSCLRRVGRRGAGRPAPVRARPGRAVPGQGGRVAVQLARARGGPRARGQPALRRPDRTSHGWLVASCVLATIGLAATGTLYGALSAGLRVRETLLPFLLLPIVAPVLLAGTRSGRRRSPAECPRRGPVAPAAGGLRRRLPGARGRLLRPDPGVGMRPHPNRARYHRPRPQPPRPAVADRRVSPPSSGSAPPCGSGCG